MSQLLPRRCTVATGHATAGVAADPAGCLRTVLGDQLLLPVVAQ